MDTHNFQEYIDFLKENVANLVQYREKTGTLETELLKVKADLEDDDPFIVFGASVLATAILADKSIYH